MPSWIGQSARRGILTSAYPREPPTADEAPESAHAPESPVGPVGLPPAVDSCPVGAIAPAAIDQGKCIRCARCLAYGLEFSGTAEGTGRSREALRTGSGAPVLPAPPLAALGRSLHVFLVDVGSCNACNLEVLALSNPYYDATRLGIFFTNSPRHADVLLVVGVPTPEMVEPLRRAYDAMPGPKSVLAVGACAVSGGIFAGNERLRPGVADVIPVDAFVPGCPPPPVAVLDGLLVLNGRGRRPGGE